MTIENISTNKSNSLYTISSYSINSNKELWNYLMNQCIDYPDIVFLTCSLICQRYKKKMNEIRDLIFQFRINE